MPRVTALRQGGAASVEVWLDGRPWRRLHEDVVVRAGLLVGVALDRERAVAVVRERRRAQAMGTALRALRARDHSAAALRERLGRHGVAAGMTDETVERLERLGVVNDARAAGIRARQLADRGFGDAAILADLDAHGFDRGAATEAVATVAPEQERLAAVLDRRGRTLATARLLARKGFAEDAIDDLIASLGDSAIA